MKNNVELLGHYGGDDTHALSAWTSTIRDIDEEKLARRPNLLKFLAENEHHTPFEKSYLHFLVTCDTASHIHIIKHRVGVSVNAESARYKELKEGKYYIPEDWPEYWKNQLENWFINGEKMYHTCLKELEEIFKFDRKRAKESARYFLSYNNQLTLDVGFNFRSFMHFQRLRNDEHAQLEIREIAETMLQLTRATNDFNESLTAFGY